MKINPTGDSGSQDTPESGLPHPSTSAASSSPQQGAATSGVLAGISTLGTAPKTSASRSSSSPPRRNILNLANRTTSSEEAVVARELDTNVLKWFKGRGIENFHVNNAAIPAGTALADASVRKVMLLTGFSVGLDEHTGKPLPETDGPPGTAALAHALMSVGKIVTLVTDKANESPTRAALAVLDKDAAKYARFINFDHKQGPGATDHAQQLLKEHAPDGVVSVELPGRTEEGNRRNMRGVSIDNANGAVDELLIQANKKGILTVGIGDGGNEAGMGGLKNIPLAKDGKTVMAASVPAQHQVTAWNSNLGAETLAAIVLQRHGKLDDLHTPEQQSAMIQASMAFGAVDGVTRGNELRAEVKVGDDTFHSGVDGFAPETHNDMLEILKTTIGKLPPNGFIAQKSPNHDRPFLVGAFDSSNGGLIAAKNLAGYLQYRSDHKASFVVVVDHHNAPYGEKTPETLVRLVGSGLKTSETAGVDVIAMACNTACTAFPEAKKDISVPVLDLIDVTADAIQHEGGTHPVVFATQATVDAGAYQQKASKPGENTVSAIAAPNWATYINNLRDPDTDPEVKADICKIVSQTPVDATSAWLCCTHYPAFQPHIAQYLESKGMEIVVHDPMSYQADAIKKELEKQTLEDPQKQHPRFKRRAALDYYILTSGTNVKEVEQAALKFLGPKARLLVEHVPFTDRFDPTNVKQTFEQVGYPASPDPVASTSEKRPLSPPGSPTDTKSPRLNA